MAPVRTRIPWRSPVRVWALAASSAILAALALAPRLHAPPARAEPAARPAGDRFHLSDEQWRGLKFATLTVAAFPVEEETDGQIAAADDRNVQVFPPFSGRVERVLVGLGDQVRSGQPLAVVRATEAAQGAADLAASAANLATARTELEVAQANLARQAALLAAQGAAQRDVDQARNDVATAAAALASAEAGSTVARARLRILGLDPAELARARRGSETAATALIRAPIGGVVLQRDVGPGQFLNSTANGATTALFTITDLSRVWLVANLREDDVAQVKVGDAVRVRVAALPDRTFTAKVAYVAPAIDPATRRAPVRAVIANPGGLLKPGMFADFTIVSAPGRSSPAVPVDAVVYDGDRARVWVARPGRNLVMREIAIGRSRGGFVQALRGVAPGEQVVTAGALFIDRAAKGD